MTQRKTDGERIAHMVFYGRYQGMASPVDLALDIDRIIRRRMAEAWDKGAEQWFRYGELSINPYRKRSNK